LSVAWTNKICWSCCWYDELGDAVEDGGDNADAEVESPDRDWLIVMRIMWMTMVEYNQSKESETIPDQSKWFCSTRFWKRVNDTDVNALGSSGKFAVDGGNIFTQSLLDGLDTRDSCLKNWKKLCSTESDLNDHQSTIHTFEAGWLGARGAKWK
jgi:hypothetical protein